MQSSEGDQLHRHGGAGKKRIHVALAEAGIGSRRACEAMVTAGRVSVNGEAAKVGQVVQPGDRIELDGQPVGGPPLKHAYYMLNKPAGVLSTVSDKRGRRTVLDLIRVEERIYPVGRLDATSEGLLLLTDDGELAYRLTHPSYQVPRIYLVLAEGDVSVAELARLQAGIPLAEGNAMVVQRIRSGEILEKRVGTAVSAGTTLLRLVLREGHKREIRRLLLATGHPVRRLQRTQIGSLSLGSLTPGRWRTLSPAEVSSLRQLVGLGRTATDAQARLHSD